MRIKQSLKNLINLIYPNICILCKKPLPHNGLNQLCDRCSLKIEKNIPPFCQKCGRQLKNCSCLQTNFHFQRAFSACVYEGNIKKLIALFKYKGHIKLASALVNILTEFIKEYKIPLHIIDLLMPIPLHIARLREREYNQSELLVKGLAKQFDMHPENDNLIRIKNTAPQVELNNIQRWQNMNGAFRIRKPENIRAKNILLVDDLITTGATCSEAAFMLKEHGAKEIYVLTLAYA